ncbi:MAG: transcription antitermination factor NusB [Saprospiraceae bacterium]
MSRDKDLSLNQVLNHYRKNIKKSFDLYLFNVLQLTEVAKYSHKDAEKRSSKHLPSAEDKAFTPKLYDNELMQSIVNNKCFWDLVKSRKINDLQEDDTNLKYYVDFAKSDEYKEYLNQTEDTDQHHKDIFLQLYRFCYANESFDDEMEGSFSGWLDDKSLIMGSMKKTIKGLPTTEDFCEAYRPTDETTVDFGEVLLEKVVNENDDLLAIIEPALKNWDVDRVAIIDMILLKMAICELTSFPSIPTKVTLNEFVEISKLYSTDKSKDFINGILDRLMKQLDKDGKIKKEGRGLKG